MGKRLDLHNLLKTITNNVYFQPPASIKITYPAIRYSLNNIENTHADNSVYKTDKSYELTYITSDPDDSAIDKISKMLMCRFDRFYTSDNLNHYVFTIYF